MAAPGNTSRTVASQLVAVCGNRERSINQQIITSCDCLGIMQDARDGELLVRFRAVLWSWPKVLVNKYVDGKTSLNLWSRDEGPFVVERALGVVSMGSDRSGDACALATWSLCQDTLPACGGLNHLRTHARFFTADNAADEAVAASTLKAPERLPHLDFEIADSSHSIMLAIKNGCKGDPIVTKTQGLFLTNKKPHQSIANLLRNSSRLRSAFKEEQQDSLFTLLCHFGWSPQRFSSRARALARSAMKLPDLLSLLAREADGSSASPSVQAARHNLREVCSYNVLMVAGLLADLCVEHHKCVREVDQANLDPAMVGAYIHKFKQRVRVLFTEGQIMKLKHCYTAQVIDFFRHPSVIFDRGTALMFARPDPADTDAVYEPLERIRSIVGNVVACLEAAVPEDGWHHSFAAFFYQAPWGISDLEHELPKEMPGLSLYAL